MVMMKNFTIVEEIEKFYIKGYGLIYVVLQNIKFNCLMLQGSEKIATFKEKFNFIERKQQAQKLLQSYPNLIPIILERDKRVSTKWFITKEQNTLKYHEKVKFMIDPQMELDKFVIMFKAKLVSEPNESIFIYPANRNSWLNVYMKF